MNSLPHDYATGILDHAEPPCLSLYQPTHRHHPDNQQDPIRFRNLLKGLEQALRENYPAQDSRRILRPFNQLEQNRDFWNHTLDGLAVFAAPDRCRVCSRLRFRISPPMPAAGCPRDNFTVDAAIHAGCICRRQPGGVPRPFLLPE